MNRTHRCMIVCEEHDEITLSFCMTSFELGVAGSGDGFSR